MSKTLIHLRMLHQNAKKYLKSKFALDCLVPKKCQKPEFAPNSVVKVRLECQKLKFARNHE